MTNSDALTRQRALRQGDVSGGASDLDKDVTRRKCNEKETANET